MKKLLFKARKIVPVLFISVLCFSIPNVSKAADKSGWQLVDTTGINDLKRGYLNGVEGGNARICLREEFGGARFSIYDNDGSSGQTLIASSIFLGNNSCYSFDARPYLDGSDNDAEFIIVTTRSPLGSVKFELWD